MGYEDALEGEVSYEGVLGCVLMGCGGVPR